MCRWHATCHWKAFDKGYNFSFDFILIAGLHTKLWNSKVAKVPILRISRFSLGSPTQNVIWVLVPWLGIEYTIRGRWWLPPSLGRGESCESMFARGSSVHQKCSNYALTNLLFGLCKSVWVIELLVNLPSPHPGTLARPSTPEVLWAKEHTPTPSPSTICTFGLVVSPYKSLGVRYIGFQILNQVELMKERGAELVERAINQLVVENQVNLRLWTIILTIKCTFQTGIMLPRFNNRWPNML
jgi:hypothetical protein